MKNDPMPLLLYPWPRGIIHLDADAFFAAVEQSVLPAVWWYYLVDKNTSEKRVFIAMISGYQTKRGGR